MKYSALAALLGGAWIAMFTHSAAAELRVVTTTKPVHALVVGVLGDVATPGLLVKGSSSPHTYTLRPSDASAVNHASVLVRMSSALEPFTAKLIATLPSEIRVTTLMDAPGLELLGLRRGPFFDGNSNASADRDAVDAHAWLDPKNAKAMVEHVAQALMRADPPHASVFRSNADELKARLDGLSAELERFLEPVATVPYVVSHDAMHYFERRFHLNAVGSISISPEVPPSAKRLTELKHLMRARGVVCVFAEPQVNMGLVSAVVEGTDALVGTLDPEALRLSPGPDLYFTLVRALAADLTRCLSMPA